MRLPLAAPCAPAEMTLPAWRRAALALLNVEVIYRPDTLEALAHGRTIVLCNHRSLLDGVILAFASPRPLLFGVTSRHAVHHPFTSRGIALLAMLGLGQRVPLDPDRPQSMRALHRALQVGQPVMIFPEGGIRRADAPGEERPGWRWLAQRTGARVARIALEGAEHAWPFAPAGRTLRPRIRLLF